MDITIKSAELMLGVRDTFLSEASAVPEEKASSRPSGILTESETERAFNFSLALLKGSLGRFIIGECGYKADNTSSVDDFVICLRTTTRTPSRAKAVATMIDSIMRESMLSFIFKPYSTELADAHATNAADTISSLESMLLTKNPPTPKI